MEVMRTSNMITPINISKVGVKNWAPGRRK